MSGGTVGGGVPRGGPGGVRPVVGVTTQHLHSLAGIPRRLPPSWVMSRRYVQALSSRGGLPWLIPLLDADPGTLRSLYDQLDGVLLPGGADFDPCGYGGPAAPRPERLDPPRDRVELTLLEWAEEEGKPVLGLCRGMQAICIAHGGALHQNLATDRPDGIKHDYLPGEGFPRDHVAHEVEVEPGSRLAEVLEPGPVAVNSMHHQGVRVLGEGLEAVAFAPDGLVEGVEVPGHPFLVGVQWHPEELADAHPLMARLFEAFLDAARAFRGVGAR